MDTNQPAAPVVPPISPVPSMPYDPSRQNGTSSSSAAMPQPPVKYAGFWVRYVAAAVDGIILAVPIIIIEFVLGASTITTINSSATMSPNIAAQFTGTAINLLVTWIYYVFMTNAFGATLGKMLVGIHVQANNGQKLALGNILLRETIGKLISAMLLLIGYIMAAFTSQKQALHDKIAGSVVVYKDPSHPSRIGLVVGIIIAVIIPLIAILGILASVVLVSLSTARMQGHQASNLSTISNMRVVMEQYYAQHTNYSVAHDCASGAFIDPLVAGFTKQLPPTATCFAEGLSYAISIPNFCVDSTGKASSNSIATDVAGTASCSSSGIPSTTSAQ